MKVPHVGFNEVVKLGSSKLLKDMRDHSEFYFIHSYFVNCKNKDIEVATSSNGKLNFSSIIKKDKVVAFQFHPEKSGKSGLLLLNNVLKNL